MDKVAYVTRQRQTRAHVCHWPGCTRQVPPAMWGCKEHWFKLPKTLRDAIWKEYRPGQEVNGTPSTRYIATALLVQEWIAGRIRVNKDGSIDTAETNEVFENRLVRQIAALESRNKNG